VRRKKKTGGVVLERIFRITLHFCLLVIVIVVFLVTVFKEFVELYNPTMTWCWGSCCCCCCSDCRRGGLMVAEDSEGD
jgi:hypothetical protein